MGIALLGDDAALYADAAYSSRETRPKLDGCGGAGGQARADDRLPAPLPVTAQLGLRHGFRGLGGVKRGRPAQRGTTNGRTRSEEGTRHDDR